MTEPKTKADRLREFADAMEARPLDWWRDYEWECLSGSWASILNESQALFAAITGPLVIRKRPRTVTRFDRNGKEVELPDLENRLVCVEVWVEGSNELPCAKEWRDHFSSLLEANDHE